MSTTVQQPPDIRAARQHSVSVEPVTITGHPEVRLGVVERLNNKVVNVCCNNTQLGEGEDIEEVARRYARRFDAVYVPQAVVAELPALSEEDRAAFEDNEIRAKLVSSLRELASFLVAHPEVPVYGGTMDLGFGVDRGDGDEAAIARVHAAAAALGIEVSQGTPGYWRAKRRFGSLVYGCSYIERGTWARVVATQTYSGAVEPDGGTARG